MEPEPTFYPLADVFSMLQFPHSDIYDWMEALGIQPVKFGGLSYITDRQYRLLESVAMTARDRQDKTTGQPRQQDNQDNEPNRNRSLLGC
jgi:hypothetical protein